MYAYTPAEVVTPATTASKKSFPPKIAGTAARLRTATPTPGQPVHLGSTRVAKMA